MPKLSDLPVVSDLDGDEAIYAVQDGVSKQGFVGNIRQYIQNGKFSPYRFDEDTEITDFESVAGTVYSVYDWSPSANSGAVKFGIFSYAVHSSNNDITGVGHFGAIIGLAQNVGSGTVALAVGVEGRVGAPSGNITIAAPILATFDRDDENAGTIDFGVGFYLPTQEDDGHIANKFAFFNNNSGWQVRTEGVINARGGLQLRDRAIEGATSWVTLNSAPSTPVVDAGFNVASLTDGGVGIITVNVTNAFAAGYKSIVTGGEGFNVVMYDSANSTSSYVLYCISLLTLNFADGRMSAAVIGGA